MTPRVTRFCSTKCDCGETHGATLGHYDRVQGSCGEVFWALQPKRGGPFILKLWPGFPGITRQQSISMLSVKQGGAS